MHSIKTSWLLLNRSKNKKLPLRGAGTRQWGRVAVAGLKTLIVVFSLTHYRLMKCTYTLTCARTACTRHGTYKASWVWRMNYGNIMSFSDEQIEIHYQLAGEFPVLFSCRFWHSKILNYIYWLTITEPERAKLVLYCCKSKDKKFDKRRLSVLP